MMRNKSKLSITIDNKLLEEVEHASKIHCYSKSRLTEEALWLWFKKHNQELMAKGYLEMAEENRNFAEQTLEAQREVSNE